MQVAVATDHAGFELKQRVLDWLKANGYTTLDLGTDSTKPVDYPDFAEALARAVLDGRAERGVLLCGSGVGASVAANKFPGIRAGLCHDNYSAHQGVEHDNMNVLALGARVIGPELMLELVRTFLAARFSGAERHVRRLEKIKTLEASICDSGRKERTMNPLRQLQEHGQSIWLDYIRRHLITSGELKRLVEEDGLSGVTSNPTIFDKAIAGSTDYDEALAKLLAETPHAEARTLFDRLEIEDIQMAADVLRPVYDRTDGADGFVSIEVPAQLAHDTAGSVAEARRLWEAVNRPQPDGQDSRRC